MSEAMEPPGSRRWMLGGLASLRAGPVGAVALNGPPRTLGGKRPCRIGCIAKRTRIRGA